LARKFLVFWAVILMCISTVYAQPLHLDSPSVILVEQTTGRVLYSRNERERRYPASMTKMLTALVALEYLELDDVIIVGQEIRNMPAGFATNVHFEGETISVQMLLHSMFIRSANETGRILALNTIRQREGRRNIPYEQAYQSFSGLMNEKARSLGARGSHFANPVGFHLQNHFTTAYDMAIITRAFMENPILSEIAGVRTFEGDSLGGVDFPEPNIREYSWTNTNQMLPGAPHGHAYVTGAKAGFTTPAGHVLAGAAYNDGLSLVTVVMGGTDAARWQDTRRLMDFGFNNFRFREIARSNEILETVLIENPRLGDGETLDVVLIQGHTALLSRSEYAALSRVITFDPLLYVENEKTTLRAPIEDGMVIGTVSYTVNGEVVFEAPVLASREVIERTFDSDMDYFLAAFFANIFTRRGLPYWFGVIGTVFGVFGIVFAISANRRAARSAGWTYEKNRKGRYNRFK
jgi:D-alanyl-D-alanine carboxypeptidase (penicillin-binding protein 5/6)